MSYLKPQTPLQHKDGDYFYPLTTVDQVIMEDGITRLSGADLVSISTDDAPEGEVAKINAELLDGRPSSDYVLKTDGMVITKNYSVVGSTTEPTNPTENMIWVQTENAIGKVHFSGVEPSSVNDNDIWIYTGDGSSVAFDAIKIGHDTMNTVYPISAKQYVSGKWVDKTAKIYQGGEWVEVPPEGTLYYRGTENTKVTGGWVETCTFTTWGSNTTTRSTATKDNDSILLSITSGAFKYSEINTSKKIDFAGYKTLVCNVTVKTPGPWWGVYLMSALTSPIPGSTTTPNIKAQKAMTNKDTGTIDISIDLSGVTESLYIVVAGFKGVSGDPNITFEVNEVRLER